MSYAVKEIFYTLQGEGANTGRAAVFCRFAGCNLWSGHEPDRATAACRFCDTDFVGVDGPGGGRFASPEALAKAIAAAWPSSEAASRFVVCTGGEPLLQLDAPLIESLHAEGFTIAIETNGTQPGLAGIDWVCVSPKAGAELVLRQGDELKVIYQQAGIDPESLQGLPFTHFFLQPMDGPDRLRNTQLAVQYCLEHPRWRLSLQTHKLLGIP
jgi:7-carboxy-7-deazaguanine synthase